MNGARVGDLFMSLIHTCELNKVNPFDYLTELLRHPAEVAVRPAEWMPWNYLGARAAIAMRKAKQKLFAGIRERKNCVKCEEAAEMTQLRFANRHGKVEIQRHDSAFP